MQSLRLLKFIHRSVGWTRELSIPRSKMHRDDIDGLRAFAVLPVIAFHFLIFPTLLTGGFVGVDIFFVISGYLITRVILHDVKSKTYSIVEFYNRRVRRIFPALFTIFVFCIIVTFFSSLPSEATRIGHSIVIVDLLRLELFILWSRVGISIGILKRTTLLHTWSLSVEEQYLRYFFR